jgi:hypothetical protein
MPPKLSKLPFSLCDSNVIHFPKLESFLGINPNSSSAVLMSPEFRIDWYNDLSARSRTFHFQNLPLWTFRDHGNLN